MGDPGPVKVFERNLNGIYENIFTYNSLTAFVKGIADINGNGDKEICIMSIEDGDSVIFTYPFYKSDSAGTLPTTFDFNFYFTENHQINDVSFGDWDNNGVTDCAFIVGAGWQQCIIAEYRDSINNFEELFRFTTTEEGDFSGFAIDDFDQDTKTELVISSGQGNVFVIENEVDNKYALVNQFPFPSSNAYMITSTNDIDGNGKPEFWITGQNFVDGITRIQCYEANGENSYRVIAYLEFRYLVSLFNEYLQAADIDGDGKEELIFSIGNAILILKFVGNVNEQSYKVYYAKFGDTTWPGSAYPVSISDLDGDGKKDLLIPSYRGYSSPLSYILRQDKPSGITLPIVNETSEEFFHNYPNPFNSVSTISFNVTETSNVQLKIFNVLGKEINILLDKELSPGKYEISWDAKDKYGNPLPSGIYFINLQAKNVFKTIKTVLIK